jgi:uncharacterized damage-inducible protein DinB
MIMPAYIRTMAEYNAEMNRRLYGASARLSDAERREPRGAFWGTIHGTLTHILWGDRQWMSRFDNWPRPTTPIKESAQMIDDFAVLTTEREKADADISRWAFQVDDAWLAEDLTWFSGAANREVRAPLRLLVTHFFNHQTHHRGQVHAMLTAPATPTCSCWSPRSSAARNPTFNEGSTAAGSCRAGVPSPRCAIGAIARVRPRSAPEPPGRRQEPRLGYEPSRRSDSA